MLREIDPADLGSAPTASPTTAATDLPAGPPSAVPAPIGGISAATQKVEEVERTVGQTTIAGGYQTTQPTRPVSPVRPVATRQAGRPVGR